MSNTLPQSILGKKILIEQELVVNSADFQMTACTIKMLPGATIRVLGNQKLTIQYSKLFSCDAMWKGISVEPAGAITFKNNQIEDAQYAIFSSGTCALDITDNTFDRNWVGMNLGLSGQNGQSCTIQFSNNSFGCSNSLRPPYLGQTPVPGQFSMSGMTVVGGIFLNITNSRFYNHSYGIIALGSVANITGCRFTDMLPGNVQGFPSGIGICAFWNAHLTITGEGNQPTSPLSFSGCVFSGVYCLSSNISVSNCRFNREGANAILTQSMANNRALIFQNRLESPTLPNAEYMFYLERSGNLSEEVYENIFEFTTPYVGGIACNGPGGANLCQIRDNILNFSGIGSIGIDLHEHRNLRVEHNMLNFNTAAKYIHLYKADGEDPELHHVRVTDNHISTGGAGNVPLFILEESPRVRLCDNHFIGGKYGMQVIGGCDKSALFTNEFNAQSEVGLLYSDGATTGIQEHRGNYWVGTFPPQSGARHEDDDNYDLSKYFVNNMLQPPMPGSTYLPENNRPDWFANFPLPVNPCPPFALGITVGVTDFDIKVANGTYDLEASTSVMAWEAKWALFDKIEHHPELKAQNALLNTFWQTQQQGAIGQLYAVEKLLREIKSPDKTLADNLNQLTDDLQQDAEEMGIILNALLQNPNDPSLLQQKSVKLSQIESIRNQIGSIRQQITMQGQLKLQAAVTLNNAVVGTNSFEVNNRLVNQTLLEHFASGDSIMNPARVNVLRGIANQCPQVAGPAAQRAMIYLPPCEQHDLHLFHDECADPRSVEHKQKLFSVKVSPNPAVENIRFETGIAEQCLLEVHAASGRLLSTQSITGPDYHMSVNGLPNGLYFYCIRLENGAKQSGKFVVSH